MTCAELAGRLDALLCGDVTVAEVRQTVDPRHLRECGACARAWTRATRLQAGLDARAEADSGLASSTMTRARTRLREALERVGHPVVKYDWLRTPLGRVFVGVTETGVCDVTFGEPSEDGYRRRLGLRVPELHRDRAAVEPALTELDAYFAGRGRRFSVAVDLGGVTEFTARVLRVARRIPFGALRTYGEVASLLGAPGSSRAVGGALGRNPVPIVIPCHRVVAHGGRLGGFTGGLEVKRALLEIEGHAPCAP